MMIPGIILLIVLLAVAVAAVAVVYAVSRARNKRLLLAVVHGTSCDGLGCVGVSVLGSDVCDAAQVENLMTVEYARYEVVLVIDARLRTREFETLLNRYRMIGVDYTPSDNLSAGTVRGLYRSRKRSYRRLVIIDREQQSSSEDFDTAAGVASYDYLLPVSSGQYLLPEAVERLVVEVEEHPAGRIEAVSVCVGDPAMLLHRDAVARAGGFCGVSGRGFFKKQVTRLWAPVFRSVGDAGSIVAPLRILAALLLAAGAGAALWSGNGPILAVLLTAVFVWCCAEYALQLSGEGLSGPVCLFGCWRPAKYKKLL